MNTQEIRERLNKNEIPYRDELPEKLYVYLQLLNEWNNRMDLTAVNDDEETLDKHFIDSLTVIKTNLIRGNTRMIDVGTGAGFPGMVLAMACPDLQVTLMDSQQKRLTFLEAVGKTTDTGNIILVHARAEDGAREKGMREQFDIAAARALAPMNVLCEYLLPYVAVGGYALCWKGPALRTEMESGRRAAHLLGGKVEMPVSCSVFGRDWEHMIMPVRKVQNTPVQFPRKAGIPKSKPLGI